MDHNQLVRAQIQKKVDSSLEHAITWTAALNVASRFSNGARCLEGKGIGTGIGKGIGPTARGSFNICYWVRVEGHPCEWVVRFPLLGMFPIESIRRKLKSEVATIPFLQEKTNVRVARVIGHGLGDEVEVPFIITEAVRGLPLNWVLAAHGEKPGVKERLMLSIAEQYLELLSHPFDHIGSLTLSETGSWSVSDGPIGLDMFDISRDGVEIRYSRPFSTSSEYFDTQIKLHERYLDEQSNAVFDRHDARQKFLTTRLFPSILERFINPRTADGPFFLTHPDLHQTNVMINPQFEVAAILDWEFSCTMPLEVACSPPICLTDDSPEQLRPGSKAYKTFQQHFKLFADFTNKILSDRQIDHRTDISSTVTEALSEKRAFFAWAVRDVRQMHVIFWDHLAPHIYAVRPWVESTRGENVIDTGEVEVVPLPSTKEFVDHQLLGDRYGGVDEWVEERLKSLAEYKRDEKKFAKGGVTEDSMDYKTIAPVNANPSDK